MNFKATFCDPFEPNIIDLGKVEKDNIIALFENTTWDEYLTKMQTEKKEVIHYSPSLEIENTDNNNGLCISAIDGNEWDIFYKRPKLKKMFFGLYTKMDNNYITDTCVQTIEEVKECLIALMNNDQVFLENKIREQTIIAPFTEGAEKK